MTYDPFGSRIIKTILVHVNPKYLVPSDRVKYNAWLALEKLKKERESVMNFIEAVEATKEGKSLTRPSWDHGMRMWWSGEILVHSHPYDSCQKKDPQTGGYIYVCEKDDAIAKDWQFAC